MVVEVLGQGVPGFPVSHFFGELDDLGDFHILVLQGNIGHPQLVGHADESRSHVDWTLLHYEVEEFSQLLFVLQVLGELDLLLVCEGIGVCFEEFEGRLALLLSLTFKKRLGERP